MIKILACITMLIDHIGLAFYPEIFWLRIIGRLAFPLFAYQVATGLLHTSDTEQYAARLFAVGLFAQLPFSLLLDTVSLNILFTFGFSVLAVHHFKSNNYFHLFTLCFIVGYIHKVLNFDYGMYGIGSVIGFYLIRGRFTQFTGDFVSALFFSLLTFVLYGYGTLQTFAFCVVPLFFFRDTLNFFNTRYYFYAFYPVHLVILRIISTIPV